MDYPNWEANKLESIRPYNSVVKTNVLPFFGKPSNKEYGQFYADNANLKPDICKNPDHSKTENPLGPNIPQEYTTTNKNDFIKFPEDVVEPF